MLIPAVETYLAVRRAADFKLDAVERYLRSFAQFATAQGDTHVVTHTAITWAEQGASEPQRHNRLNVVVRFARFSHAEDPRHEVPPARLFCGQRRPRSPYLFREGTSRPSSRRPPVSGHRTRCAPIPTALCWACWL
jgi:hypothetical protein